MLFWKFAHTIVQGADFPFLNSCEEFSASLGKTFDVRKHFLEILTHFFYIQQEKNMLTYASSELRRTLEVIWVNILILQIRSRKFVSESRTELGFNSGLSPLYHSVSLPLNRAPQLLVSFHPWYESGTFVCLPSNFQKVSRMLNITTLQKKFWRNETSLTAIYKHLRK